MYRRDTAVNGFVYIAIPMGSFVSAEFTFDFVNKILVLFVNLCHVAYLIIILNGLGNVAQTF